VKQILVVGAGQSAPYLIANLLEHAESEDWFVTVGDLSLDLARERIGDHPRGSAVLFDVEDSDLRSSFIEKADVVVNMLPPTFQNLIAWDCVNHGRHMVSASYREKEVRHLDLDAKRRGVLLLCEMGLDPGIDHMSAMSLIRRVHAEGGRITAFRSYGSGLPVPYQQHNPLWYVITWNPRNVVMAGSEGAQYMEHGRIKIVPYHQVFHHTWPVEVDGMGELEAYPNRDSMSYMQTFGLEHVHTMIRGTLRYPGWSETWSQIVQLGLPNENLRIPDLGRRSCREVVEMFLPLNISEAKVEQRIARFLHISPTGRIMKNLRWLGLLDTSPCGCEGNTAAEMLRDLLVEKLPLGPDGKDVILVVHEMDVEYPDNGGKEPQQITSTLAAESNASGFTAMSKAVGLPAAIAVKLILRDELQLTGSYIPTHPSIYEPVLRELHESGLSFQEKTTPLL
jgi:saccharopine dehydrogenase-like NADP-dependent oxidoreductase